MTESADIRERMDSVAKKVEMDALHTFKGFYNAAAGEALLYRALGSLAAVCGAVGGATGIAHWQPAESAIPWIALAASAVTAWLTFLMPAERAERYRRAGCEFQHLRDDTRFFRRLELPSSELDQLVLMERMRALATRCARLREDSPQLPTWAHKRARRGIEELGEADYHEV